MSLDEQKPIAPVTRPVVFISHAASDAEIARVIKAEIDKVFANAVDVFASTAPGALPAGDDWLSQIRKKLGDAAVVLVIVTPTSVERPWVWFEVGASWEKMEEKEGLIIPLVVKEVSMSDLPEPISRLQAKSLDIAEEIKEVFEALHHHFGIGDLKKLKPGPLKQKIPKYNRVKVVEADQVDRTFYDGPYAGYSDEELEEVLDDNFWSKNHVGKRDGFGSGSEGYHIANGKLLHFRQLDNWLKLPVGTSKRLLAKVALRYGFVVSQESDHTVRFEYDRDEDPTASGVY